ncbi:MAG: T9SS type A sorting domain-containing protein [Bacteroidales bacterium]|nr:T9SS type A sorting domain-containing protein [Bacteroidales bacterium]
MRISGLLLFLFLILILSSTSAQDPKPPEAFDDFAETVVGGRVLIQVLANDFCEQGHEMTVLAATAGNTGHTILRDSAILFVSEPNSPAYYYPGQDTFYYRIKDLENGLVSDMAAVYINLLPFNFDTPVDSLDINNYKVSFNTYGNYFEDIFHTLRSKFIIPQSSNKSTIFDCNLFYGGKHDQYYREVAGEKHTFFYLESPTSDFWPGPIMSGDQYTLASDSIYNKIWKVNRQDVLYHLSNWQNINYQADPSIANWPGNRLIQGDYPMQLASYVDNNSNGIYEPELGDAPSILGDQAVLAIYNDQRTTGISTGNKGLGIEVHQMSYAFKCENDSDFYNTFFVRYLFINKSANVYSDFRVGLDCHFLIGHETDDYIGCDTGLNCFFAYNDSIDDFIGYKPSYTNHPPAQAICFLNQELSSFIGPIQDFNAWGPGIYWDYLHGVWGYEGEPMTYGGNGHGGTDTTTFLFPDDPSDPSGWSNIQTVPGFHSYGGGIGSAGPFIVNPDDTLRLDVAYVFARDYNGTNLSSVDLLKERIERIQWFYDNDSTPCSSPWSGQIENKVPDQGKGIILTPNPCNEVLQIQLDHLCCNQIASYSILNINGRIEKKGFLQSSNDVIAVNTLAAGMYVLKIEIENQQFVQKFIKK